MSHQTFVVRLTTIVILAAAIILALASAAVEASPRCYEDQPCWAWSKMGNHKRGIVLKNGRRAVVGVQRFKRLDSKRRIDWTATPRLRGDWTARQYRPSC